MVLFAIIIHLNFLALNISYVYKYTKCSLMMIRHSHHCTENHHIIISNRIYITKHSKIILQWFIQFVTAYLNNNTCKLMLNILVLLSRTFRRQKEAILLQSVLYRSHFHRVAALNSTAYVRIIRLDILLGVTHSLNTSLQKYHFTHSKILDLIRQNH